MTVDIKVGHILTGIGAAVVATTLMSSITTVEEGYRGVYKVTGEAKSLLDPGLHFKLPFISTVVPIEVRQRYVQVQMEAADKDQLATGATVSVNWSITPASVLQIYREYGTVDDFEARILTPRTQQAGKAALAQYSMADLIVQRSIAQAKVSELLQVELKDYPVVLQSVQIENLNPPAQYRQSVLDKKKAEEDAARAEFELARQKTEAQKEVNTAEADRDAVKARADGAAYATREAAKAEADAILAKGEAEAKAIRARGEAAAAYPVTIDIERIRQWNGQLPTTVLGEGTAPLMQIK